jgi:hypothetical protein
MRLMVATRLSLSGPRIALLTKFGPPCPWLVASRWLASAIWVSRSARLRSTSACAWAGIAGSRSATVGQTMLPGEALWLVWAAATPSPSPTLSSVSTPVPSSSHLRRGGV